jgi:4-amino-4-deoxy-L-arabinose transferase-like glycosyltransferase
LFPFSLNPITRRLVYLLIFLTALATYVTRVQQSGRLHAPPEPGDSHDYEAIAFNLWKLRGYGYYWSDPEYRAPYEGRAGYGGMLRRQSEYYPTAYRPPLFPVLLSGIYALADRNFAAWRVINCALVAGALTLAAMLSAQFAGLLAAPLTAFFVLQSGQLTRSSQIYMTEGIAAFLVTLLAWLWVTNTGRGWTRARAATFGIVLGALLAARSIFVLWLPLALLVPAEEAAPGRWRRWRGTAVCLVCAILVIAPWWARNIVVTGAFMPTGTQAPLNLPMGFGPRALMYRGLWRGNRGDGVQELEARNVNPTSIEWEVQLAKIRSAIALKWMRENPRDVLRLMGLHVWQEIRPRNRGVWDWLLPAACLALVLFRKSPGTVGVAVMLVANLFSIAMTWGAGGRFMLPVQPLMLALISAAIVLTLTRAWRMMPNPLAGC